MNRKELRTQLGQLKTGLPQDWIYIDRHIVASLEDKDIKEGVRAPFQFIKKTIDEVFSTELLELKSSQSASIRPIIGMNGAGKSTLLQLQLKKILVRLFK